MIGSAAGAITCSLTAAFLRRPSGVVANGGGPYDEDEARAG